MNWYLKKSFVEIGQDINEDISLRSVDRRKNKEIVQMKYTVADCDCVILPRAHCAVPSEQAL